MTVINNSYQEYVNAVSTWAYFLVGEKTRQDAANKHAKELDADIKNKHAVFLAEVGKV